MDDLPDDLTEPTELPPDHERRMVLARRFAQWHLGYSSWADELMTAYLTPSVVDFDEMEK